MAAARGARLSLFLAAFGLIAWQALSPQVWDAWLWGEGAASNSPWAAISPSPWAANSPSPVAADNPSRLAASSSSLGAAQSAAQSAAESAAESAAQDSAPRLSYARGPSLEVLEPAGLDPGAAELPGYASPRRASSSAAPRAVLAPEDQTGTGLDTSPVRRLVIPALKLDVEVAEVAFTGRTWDVSWLGARVGLLGETSRPGLGGNTVLAGHITASLIGNGPFRYLHRLQAGDAVIVYTAVQVYHYRVREQVVIKAEDGFVTAATLRPQLTLLTCTNWDEKQDSYRNRRAVFADLVRVEPIDETIP